MQSNKEYTWTMIILFILGLVLGGLAVVFSLQNIEVVTVAFFNWEMTGSLSIVLLMAILTGMLVVLCILLPGSIGNYFRYKKLKNINTRLEEELRKQKELTHFAKEIPPTANDLRKIEEGVIEQHAD
jgi:uncharacterized integral membrane protein